MAESKFAGMFSEQAETKPPRAKKAATKAIAAIPDEPPAGKPQRVKPLSKAKDPNWKGFYVFLQKSTHTEATYQLRKLDTGEDFSDLMERLLTEWLSKSAS